jgi:plastocyanin
MSDDETPTADPSDAAPDSPAEQPVAEGAVATIEEPATPVAPEHAPVPADPVTFTNKFLLPLIVPIAVAATIIFYVLNVSRIFLASDNVLAVTYATIITVLILGGGSALAAKPEMRSSSLTLLLGGGFLVLLMGGLISIGAASPKGTAGPVACTPVAEKLTVVAGANNALRFDPSTPTEKAGCIQVSLTIEGSHTLQFDDPVAAAAFPLLGVNQKSWAGTLPAGKYAFHCTIDGHAAAGMVGSLTVTS